MSETKSAHRKRYFFFTRNEWIILSLLVLVCIGLAIRRFAAAPLSFSERSSRSDTFCATHVKRYTFSQAETEPGNVCALIVRTDIELHSLLKRSNEFTNLQNLLILGVPHARLTAQVSNLQMLYRLNIQLSEDVLLPSEIGTLPRLKELVIKDTDVYRLPPEVGNIHTLERLSIINSPHLTLVPATIAQLPNLKVLSLTFLPYLIFPKNFTLPAGLTTLDLSADNLTEIPSFVYNAQDLTSINFNLNKLQHIPAELTRLTNLEELYLSENEIVDLPPLNTLRKLRSIDVSTNALQTVPDGLAELPTVQYIGLHTNPIPPKSITTLRKKLPHTVIPE